jgi:hypothetical protein
MKSKPPGHTRKKPGESENSTKQASKLHSLEDIKSLEDLADVELTKDPEERLEIFQAIGISSPIPPPPLMQAYKEINPGMVSIIMNQWLTWTFLSTVHFSPVFHVLASLFPHLRESVGWHVPYGNSLLSVQ